MSMIRGAAAFFRGPIFEQSKLIDTVGEYAAENAGLEERIAELEALLEAEKANTTRAVDRARAGVERAQEYADEVISQNRRLQRGLDAAQSRIASLSSYLQTADHNRDELFATVTKVRDVSARGKQEGWDAERLQAALALALSALDPVRVNTRGTGDGTPSPPRNAT